MSDRTIQYKTAFLTKVQCWKCVDTQSVYSFTQTAGFCVRAGNFYTQKGKIQNSNTEFVVIKSFRPRVESGRHT